MGAFTGGFASMSVVFAVLYGLTRSVTNVAGAGVTWSEDLYFSLITQATVGYGDLIPKGAAGHALVALQILFGLSWIALAPAAVLIRLLAPAERTIRPSRLVVFDPHQRIFIVRLVNTGGIVGQLTTVVIHLRIPLRANRYSGRRIAVRLRSSMLAHHRFPAIMSMTDYSFGTDEAPEVPPSLEGRVFETTLHPAHIRKPYKLYVSTSFDVLSGRAFREACYEHEAIVCGKMPQTRLDEESYDWSAFDDYTSIGEEYCRRECIFRLTCNISNKFG